MAEFSVCRPEEFVDGVILCATRRLARRLRRRHDEAQRAAGAVRWPALEALTLDAWLGRVVGAALLAGEFNPRQAPRLALSAFQERMLWERALAADAGAAGEESLFDREGLAAAAADANDLAEVWGLQVDERDGAGSEELRRFLHWRRHFRMQCEDGGWLEPARLRGWQLRVLAAGAGRLPTRLAFAGFDRHTPQEDELVRLLRARGTEVIELALGQPAPGTGIVAALPDRAAECRAVAAWAADRLARNPQARLGIVVPQLAALRPLLAAALDDALHPEALAPGHGEMARCYNVSLGAALAQQPLVAAALQLLAMAAASARIAQADLGRLLCGPWWSAAVGEADGRARLDAQMREQLPPELRLAGVLRLARRLRDRGLRIGRCVADLETLHAFAGAHGGARRPSYWAMQLAELLDKCGWPGERGLSSHEWQAREALLETLQAMETLDAVVGKIGLGEAVRLLARQCRERVFQPETEGDPAIEVMGPLEAAGAQFDALWVLGMNDDVWPPPPRPNPLLPATLQRRARSAHASAEVQLEFAAAVQRRLLHSAPLVVFSHACAEGDRPLRCSPLLQALAAAEDLPAATPTVAEANCAGGRIEAIEDRCGPPLPAGTLLRGGVGLLRAQALCPAWAFFRYRLGARALAEPVEGLDAAQRGTLLHRAMERLWQDRDSATMQAMSPGQRQAATAAAAEAALAWFAAGRDVPLPARYAALEGAHLARLLDEWLAMELKRPDPFAVVECEQSRHVDIDGLEIDLTVDRVDELADGRRLLIDYKSRRELKPSAWLDARPSEPQLPVYATWGAPDAPPAAVAFGRVRPGECGFVGIGGEALAEGIRAVDDWPQTLARWRAAIAAIAGEIRNGEAGVVFAAEKDLHYCEVLPLLRLPERQMQMESA